MHPEDKREVSTVSGSCQVDVLICERQGSCLHDSRAGETARHGCCRDGRRHLGHKDREIGSGRRVSRRGEN